MAFFSHVDGIFGDFNNKVSRADNGLARKT
jgi:hypothetical protein